MDIKSFHVSRRHVLGGIAGAVAVGAFRQSLAAMPSPSLVLRPSPGRSMLTENGEPTAVWSYGDTVPGPLIRVRQGERVNVRLENGLSQPTSVHWHGIRIENSMDGVAGITQDPVPPGGEFDYSFVLPDAGTYWYHPHFRSWEQLARGLYGVLIIDEADPPKVDHDLVFCADDWRMTKNNQIDAQSFGQLHDWAHAGRLGNWLTVNGQMGMEYSARPGARVRLRMLNVANARILAFNLGSLPARVVAIDGQPIVSPAEPGNRLILAPGQRADVILDLPGPGPGTYVIQEVSGAEPIEAARIVTQGVAVAAPRPALDAVALLPNPVPEDFAFEDAVVVPLRMEGGAMGRMDGATYKGAYYGIRDLVGKNQAWAFNGIAGLPEKPLASVAKGRTIVVDMINDTRWPHAMHLHGHHFRVIARNGKVVTGTPWRDTELVDAGERVRIAFVANNPGKWVFHCHMLEHQAAGMITWLEVVDG